MSEIPGSVIVELAASDRSVQRKSAFVLDRSARWAVPALLRALKSEEQPLVTINILNALGRIGGAQALEALEAIYRTYRPRHDANPDILRAVESALAVVRLEQL